MKGIKIILIFILSSSVAYSQWTRQADYISNYEYGRALDACDDSTAVFYGASGTGQGLYITLDGGKTWNPRFIPEDYVTDVSLIDRDNIWYVTSSGNVYHSSNKGVKWSKQTSIGMSIEYLKMFDKFYGVMIPDNTTDGLSIYVSASSGIGWWQKQSKNIGGNLSDWRRVDFVSNQNGFFFDAMQTQKLYRTGDGGNSWEATNYAGYASLIKFCNADTGLAVSVNWDSNKFVIQKTTDGGKNWATVNTILSGTWPSDMEFVPNNPDKIWFAANDNLFYSSDGGQSWTHHILDTETSTTRDIKFVDENNGWILCDNGKIYNTKNNGGYLTSIDNKLENNDRLMYTLLNNYPNPFNPNTNIEFTIPEREYVELNLYNILGQKVKILLNKEISGGHHTVRFNGENFSSGIYYYQLKTNKYSIVRKMLLLK